MPMKIVRLRTIWRELMLQIVLMEVSWGVLGRFREF